MTDNRPNEPTESQVEAAAKALYEYETGLGVDSWDRTHEVERSLWRDQARAALVAAAGVGKEKNDECEHLMVSDDLDEGLVYEWCISCGHEVLEYA